MVQVHGIAVLRPFTSVMHPTSLLFRWTKSIATDHGYFDLVSVFLLIAEVIILACIIIFVPCELDVIL